MKWYLYKNIPCFVEKLAFTLIIVVTFKGICTAQPTAGNTGLLNTPSANMQADGTIMFGTNYLPHAMTHETFTYNTSNYYMNLTFLPFCEVSYRCTLIKTKTTKKYNQQDRSFAIRLRLIREKKTMPSIVIGGNDIYTSTPEKGSQYFGATYLVSTKHFQFDHFSLDASLGFGSSVFESNTYNGWFGGVILKTEAVKTVDIISEYDTHSINLGATFLLFNHLSLYAFAYDCQYFCGGLYYQFKLKK